MNSLEEKYLDTSRGFRYRYYVSEASQADSSKPALLLCHGWPDSADLWQYVLPHLSKSNNRLVIPDLLGYGGTSKPTDPQVFEISAMVSDVMEIIHAENITQKIIPMGHDWGSYLAQRIYLLNKPYMTGLITLNVALMPPRSDPFDLAAANAATEKLVGYPVYAYWELFADPSGPALMDQHLESVWHAMHGTSPGGLRPLWCTRGAMREWVSQSQTSSVPLKLYAQNATLHDAWISGKQSGGLTSPGCWYRALVENVHLATEKRLDARVDDPYLFIGCTGDDVCRTDFIEGPRQAGLVSDLTVREIESGHWCPLEKPEEVGKIVVEWLKAKGFSS